MGTVWYRTVKSKTPKRKTQRQKDKAQMAFKMNEVEMQGEKKKPSHPLFGQLRAGALFRLGGDASYCTYIKSSYNGGYGNFYGVALHSGESYSIPIDKPVWPLAVGAVVEVTVIEPATH